MKLPGICAGLLLGVVLTFACARAQIESPTVVVGGASAAAVEPEQIKRAYADAKPYMDDELRDLKHTVPALEGLKADASQSNLQSILDRTGEVTQTQMPRIPDLTAHESVWQTQLAVPAPGQEGGPDGVVYMGGRGRSAGQIPGQMQEFPAKYTSEKELEDKLHSSLLTGPSWKDFDYIVLSRRSPEGVPMLVESRTDLDARNGGSQTPEQKTPHGTGFGYVWLLFLPQNMLQANYHFLGQQKMYGHETYVVAFAQSPDQVKVPGEITFLGTVYPMLYQGVAWIDEATFRIVRLRTDLLAPQPSIDVRWLSSDLRFSEVRIPEQDAPLWLPHQVELTWRQADRLFGEMHVYTKYRLFHATARILPPS